MEIFIQILNGWIDLFFPSYIKNYPSTKKDVIDVIGLCMKLTKKKVT